jgi:hypothetical protein
MADIVHAENLPFATAAHQHLRYTGADARARSIEKLERTLLHLLDWHYTSVPALMPLLNVQKSAAEETLTKLLDEKLLQLIPTTASAGRVAMLTAFGRETAFGFASPTQVDLKVPVHPSRVRTELINHNLIAQWFALYARRKAIDLGASEDELFIVPANRIQKLRYQAGDQIPDAETGCVGTPPTEIEVQETYSTTFPRRLSRLCERIAAGTSSGGIVVSTNKSLLDYYEGILKNELRYWAYLATKKRWHEMSGTRSPYDGDVVGNVHFFHVDQRRRFYRF